MSQPSFELDLDDQGEPTYSVAELAEALNVSLRRSFRDGVWVRGEIEGLQVRGGHTYFTLAEATDGGRATVSVALFARAAARLRPALARARLRLDDGLQVRIHGHLEFYAPAGRLNLRMDGIDPRFTLGELAGARDQLLRRLVAAGLLDRNAARPLPAAPLRVGVVTSRESAAWHDLVDELARSGIGFEVRHCDVRVQGAGAPRHVAAAITALGRHDVDVVVVVRGGGARSDLATFDTEEVATAIASCPKPVLTGLGHEIDRSVADEVAHTALKTPTACAVHLVERVRSHQRALDAAWAAAGEAVLDRLAATDGALAVSARRAAARTALVVRASDARLASLSSRVGRAASRRVDEAALTLRQGASRLAVGAGRHPRDAERHLDAVHTAVRALDPARVLARGWSITRTAAGAVVRQPSQVGPGDVLHTTVAGGTIRSRVDVDVTSDVTPGGPADLTAGGATDTGPGRRPNDEGASP